MMISRSTFGVRATVMGDPWWGRCVIVGHGEGLEAAHAGLWLAAGRSGHRIAALVVGGAQTPRKPRLLGRLQVARRPSASHAGLGRLGGGLFWFSSAAGSRKVRNLMADARCSVAIDDALDPVIVEGVAEIRADADDRRRYLDAMNAKYRSLMVSTFWTASGICACECARSV